MGKGVKSLLRSAVNNVTAQFRGEYNTVDQMLGGADDAERAALANRRAAEQQAAADQVAANMQKNLGTDLSNTSQATVAAGGGAAATDSLVIRKRQTGSSGLASQLGIR
jgi:hypothetical protein